MTKKTDSSALKIIPLGGLKEIGKNTWVFEINDEIMLLDGGLGFPGDGMHGVNIVLPDMTYLRQNRHKIKGMVVTHGHEDHIGGIAFHLRQFDIPVIYGPRLGLALLEGKLREAGVLNRTELRTVGPRDMVRIGNNFFVEFIRNTHSMADSFCVAINSPAGLVIHSGDFKVDHTPVDGEFFDFQRLAEHGEKGVLCLISDSTNAEVPGYTPSERAVAPGLERAIASAKGRVFITTFASSVHRLNIILELAEKMGRVVGVVGRSMLNVIAHARNLGYVKCRDELLQPLQNLRQYRDDQILILTTGSQGESMSALTRMAEGRHRQLQIREGDTVVFSANPIPGNVIPVVHTIDKLMTLGANVVYGKDKGIHVSGHGAQEDQKLMLSLVKPKFFFPAHGEYRMLRKHASMAQDMGIPADNIVIAENGDVIQVSQDGIGVVDKVPSGIELVDASREGVVDGDVLRDRQTIAGDGVITIAASINLEGKLATSPDIRLSGVVLPMELSKLNHFITETINDTLGNKWATYARNLGETEVDWTGLRYQLERDINRRLRSQMQSRPMLILLMQTPEQDGVASNGKKSNGSSSKASVKDDKPATTTPAAGKRKRAAASVS
jgi:ribonuclease J